MGKIRTFIAIKIPSSIVERISQFQSSLKKVDARIGWVKSGNFHITLKFLGDVEESKITEIGDKLENSLSGIKNFEVNIGGVGVFPTRRRPRVLWIGGSSENSILEKIAERLDDSLHTLGFERESRKYRIHLTLGRVKESGNIEEVMNKLFERKDINFGAFEVSEVVLIQSELNPSGSIYTPLKIVHLES